MKKIINQKLFEIKRQRRGISVKQAAFLLSVSEDKIHVWEESPIVAPLNCLYRMAELYGVQDSELQDYLLQQSKIGLAGE